MAVYDGTKCQAVPKGRGHVPDFHIAVVLTLYPTPLLESLQRSHRPTVQHTCAAGLKKADKESMSFSFKRRQGRQETTAAAGGAAAAAEGRQTDSQAGRQATPERCVHRVTLAASETLVTTVRQVSELYEAGTKTSVKLISRAKLSTQKRLHVTRRSLLL